ncbi:hypothetical protein C8F04DRAFT_1277831 [Mycena alexandri]|uniref:Uncharacterized protein n=1 Tax=Mycena alexandri TaxID=1745969 RepID=A0AAD6RZA9_9AGAR|nr:hypothetical protein C8F04DRAFT_1277831 [Mycena alexandri]
MLSVLHGSRWYFIFIIFKTIFGPPSILGSLRVIRNGAEDRHVDMIDVEAADAAAFMIMVKRSDAEVPGIIPCAKQNPYLPFWGGQEFLQKGMWSRPTAALMLDWTTHCTRSNIIRRVADRRPWPPSEMQALETAVCEYYTTAFYEYFGRAAVIPMPLDHDAEMEDMEDGEI